MIRPRRGPCMQMPEPSEWQTDMSTQYLAECQDCDFTIHWSSDEDFVVQSAQGHRSQNLDHTIHLEARGTIYVATIDKENPDPDWQNA